MPSPQLRIEELLDAFNASAAPGRAAVEEQILREFGVPKAVLVLDMSGFTRIVRELGIVPYMAMIRRMQTVTRDPVERFGGEVVKYEADNLFAVFDTSHQAVRAADAIAIALEAVRAVTSSTEAIYVGVGIAFGTILLIPGVDLMGPAVNCASRLGEDYAKSGEILVSEEVYASIKQDQDYPCTPIRREDAGPSGVTCYFRLERLGSSNSPD